MVQHLANRILLAVMIGAIMAQGSVDHSGEGPSSTLLLPITGYVVPNFDRHCMYATVEVAIGTPPQERVYLAFDTGSFIPVVYNTSCTDKDCGISSSTSKKYNTGESSSVNVSYNKPVVTHYGAGNTSGYMARDNFSFPAIGGGDNNQQQAMINWNQSFSIIDSVSWLSNQAGLAQIPGMSGIFGMAPGNPWIPPQDKDNDLSSLRYKFGIDQFAVQLTQRGNLSSGAAGQVQLGGYSALLPANHVEEIHWGDVLPISNWWVVEIEKILVNGVPTKAFNHSSLLPAVGLFDTGAGLLAMIHSDINGTTDNKNECRKRKAQNNKNNPFALVPQKRQQLDASIPDGVFSCTNTSFLDSLPNISVVISGKAFTLEPQDYILKLGDGQCQSVLFLYNPTTTATNKKKGVASASTSSSSTSDEDLTMLAQMPKLDLGIMWTARVTTIFDYKKYRMGFIPRD